MRSVSSTMFGPRGQRTTSSSILGQPISGTDSPVLSPALVIDQDNMETNLATMKEYVATVNAKSKKSGGSGGNANHQVRLRPHAKLHKCSQLAKLQIEQGGAVGMCVQKISEAESLANGGVKDLFISNQVISIPKLLRVRNLHEQLLAEVEGGGGKLTLCVDSEEGLDLLLKVMKGEVHSSTSTTVGPTSNPIGVFIEVECGQKRCGVRPVLDAGSGSSEMPLLGVLAQKITSPENSKFVQFEGLHAYHGFAQHIRSYAERQRVIKDVTIHAAANSKRYLEDILNIPVPLVTGAGTGTFSIEATSGLYQEIQPGSYLVMDKDYGDNLDDMDDNNPRGEVHPIFKHALFLKAQVVSWQKVQKDGLEKGPFIYRVVLDSGHKSGAIDSGLPGLWNEVTKQCYPSSVVLVGNGGDDHTLLEFEEEHAAIATSLFPLGATAWLVPNHCDPTFNLHDFAVGVRGGLGAGGVVETIYEMDARGCQW